MERERRTFAIDRAAIRARSDNKGLGFRGHATVFDQRAWIGPAVLGFWEEIAPRSTAQAIEGDDVRFLVDHDSGKVLARNTSGTLRLSEDKNGLLTDADMADVSYARDLAVLIERGDVSQMSFAFVPRKLVDPGDPPAGWRWELGWDDQPVGAMWTTLASGEPLRRLVNLELFDVSVVAYPAYEGTDAGMRFAEARRADARSNRLLALRVRLDAAYHTGGHP